MRVEPFLDGISVLIIEALESSKKAPAMRKWVLPPDNEFAGAMISDSSPPEL